MYMCMYIYIDIDIDIDIDITLDVILQLEELGRKMLALTLQYFLLIMNYMYTQRMYVLIYTSVYRDTIF